MKCGVRWLSAMVMVVGACARDPEVVATAQPSPQALAPAEATAPVTGEVVAAEADAPRTAVAAAAPQSLFEFSERLASPAGLEQTVLSDEDFARLFTPRRGDCDDPSASCTVGDLDGDGRDEDVVVIDAGWWHRWFDVCVFRAEARGRTLAHHLRIDGAVRGASIGDVRKLGSRRWLQVGCTDGWGTGYLSGASMLFELHAGHLVEVLRYRVSLEEICGGYGPVLTVSSKQLELDEESDTGLPVARVSSVVQFDGARFDGLSSETDVHVEVEWTQPAPGQPFVPKPKSAPWTQTEELWRAGARCWLQEHAAEVTPRIATADTGQLEVLRRTCDMATEAGPHRQALEVQRLLPPR